VATEKGGHGSRSTVKSIRYLRQTLPHNRPIILKHDSKSFLSIHNQFHHPKKFSTRQKFHHGVALYTIHCLRTDYEIPRKTMIKHIRSSTFKHKTNFNKISKAPRRKIAVCRWYPLGKPYRLIYSLTYLADRPWLHVAEFETFYELYVANSKHRQFQVSTVNCSCNCACEFYRLYQAINIVSMY
jgi:hypothetical protein